MLSSDTDVASDDITGTANYPGCGLIPITVESINTLALIDVGALVEVGTGGTMYNTPVVVSSRKEKPNYLIWADFLACPRLQFDT